MILNSLFNLSTNHLLMSLKILKIPVIRSAQSLILQNLPALSIDLSNTGIQNFICFRNQPLKSLNVSRTKIIELHTLENYDLRALNISHTSISNLAKLQEFSLRVLNISHSAVRQITVLKDLVGLEKLYIHDGQLSKSQIKRLPPQTEVIIVP